MKLAFLLPCNAIAGGVLTVLEHARALRAKGHHVSIFFENEMFPLPAGDRHTAFLKDVGREVFDFAMATWWETANAIEKIPARHYGYFVQGFEDRFYAEEDLAHRQAVIESFRPRLHLFTVSEALRAHLRARHGRDAILIRNAVHPNEAKPRLRPSRFLRVLVEGAHCHPLKRIPLAFSVAGSRNDVETVFLTSDSGPAEANWGIDYRFDCVPYADTPAIYRSCDILLKLSATEGFPLAVLDMFAAGGTAIASAFEGHEELVRDGENGLVVPIDDAPAAKRALARLVEDGELLAKLRAGARETCARFDWQKSHDALEDSLRYICAWPEARA